MIERRKIIKQDINYNNKDNVDIAKGSDPSNVIQMSKKRINISKEDWEYHKSGKRKLPQRKSRGSWTSETAPITKGRPKLPPDFIKTIRSYSIEAADRLLFWVRSDEPKTSLAASIYIINRAWGAPVQATEISGPGGSPIQVPSLVVNFVSAIQDKEQLQTIDLDNLE